MRKDSDAAAASREGSEWVEIKSSDGSFIHLSNLEGRTLKETWELVRQPLTDLIKAIQPLTTSTDETDGKGGTGD